MNPKKTASKTKTTPKLKMTPKKITPNMKITSKRKSTPKNKDDSRLVGEVTRLLHTVVFYHLSYFVQFLCSKLVEIKWFCADCVS